MLSAKLMVKLIFWKKGTEYLGVEPIGGERTRCDVARARPWVANSNAVYYGRYGRQLWVGEGGPDEPFPMLTTKVPGMGGASIHCPERFWTWRPG